MYWEYLKAVLVRALQPTVRVTDGLQILAASASPALGKLLGIKMPDTIGNDVLAYIGAAALAFIIIRFFWAPYSLWKEDKVTIVGLRDDLGKPERLVAEHIAKHRAKAVMKIIKKLHELHTHFFVDGLSDARRGMIAKLGNDIVMLSHKANLSEAFRDALHSFEAEGKMRATKNETADRKSQDFEVLDLLQAHLHGQITAEYLLSQLPPDIEPGTQP